jgi:electron transfer flavoprotein alpha subunit
MGIALVVAEHLNGKLRKVTLSAVSFAQEYVAITGGEVVGLVLGSGAGAVAEELAVYGVSRVILADDANFENPLAESYAPAVVSVARSLEAELICGPASMVGKDYLPRVADALEAGMVADAVAVWDDEGSLRFRRPMWAGNVLAEICVETAVVVATVRPTAYDAPPAGDAAPVEAGDVTGRSDVSRFHKLEQVVSERPDLNDADIIVSGGRGLRSAENFGMITDLADVLGAGVGASRAAVDSGMAPNDWQVGQTGKIVAPDLYFAIAISGAIQHLAGMKGSKTIVAINKDPEAPIFQVADYGLVADAFKVVPELIEALKVVKAES